MRKITLYSMVMLLAGLAGCLKEDPMKQAYKGFAPADIGDGWTITVPSKVGIDSVALDNIYKDIYADDEMWMTKSLLVFREGYLIGESYMKSDEDRTKADAIWSCTKQVNGIITGIAIHEGFINDVTDPVSLYLPEYIQNYPDKSGLTLEHLLTMNSGTTYDNGTDSDKFRQRKVDSSLDFVLSFDMAHQPGSYFWYNDGDPQVVSGIVQAATGKTLSDYGKEVLLDPLGISNFEWEVYQDGVTLGAFGILTTAREMAKIAQCVLDSGMYGGRQLIPKDWLVEMLSAKVTGLHDDLVFGYFWWGMPTKGYHFMWGHGGQYAFIIPEKDMLVIITSLPQIDDDVNIPISKIIGIVDRIVETAD